MIPDLYKCDLRTISQEELVSAVTQLVQAQPDEGWLLEYKKIWQRDYVEVIAAFANTFGGLLVLGVSEDEPRQIVGVEAGDGFKTQLASTIAGNIVPCPAFDIAVCGLRDNPGRRLCVIRIYESSKLHLLTTKGAKNIAYVRNVDETPPANAVQLRALIERERLAIATSGKQRPIDPWGTEFGIQRLNKVDNGIDRGSSSTLLFHLSNDRSGAIFGVTPSRASQVS